MSRRSRAGRHNAPTRGHRDSGRAAPANGRKPELAETTGTSLPQPPASVPELAQRPGDVALPTEQVVPVSTTVRYSPAGGQSGGGNGVGGARNGNSNGNGGSADPAAQAHRESSSTACTAPQLRRFIKSRAYVPMHELRRRFGINGAEDDVTPVDVDSGRIFVGLPGREGELLGELLRAGDIGFELSMDPRTPVVIGVYPMRPIPRS